MKDSGFPSGSKPRSGILKLLCLLALLYVLGPLIFFIYSVLTKPRFGSSQYVISAFITSLTTATLSTSIIYVCFIPLAFYLSQYRHKKLFIFIFYIISIPIALPPLIDGIFLLRVIGPLTFFGRLTNGSLTDSTIGIILSQVFVACPFAVITARYSFDSIDPAIFEFSKTVKTSFFKLYHQIARPAARTGVRAALLLSWLRSFGEFGATLLVSYHPYSIPVLVYVDFSSTGIDSTNLVVLLTLGTAIIIIAITELVRRPKNFWTRLNSRTKNSIQLISPPGIIRKELPSLSYIFDFNERIGSFRLKTSIPIPTRRLAVLGVTGAGKSTLLKLISGVYENNSGRLDFYDLQMNILNRSFIHVGYVPQHGSLIPNKSIDSQLMIYNQSFREKTELAYWVKHLNLQSVLNSYPCQLSGGQYKKVVLARALSKSPSILVLDEPFSSLDTVSKNSLIDEMLSLEILRDTALIISTHDINDALSLADHILVIKDGQNVQFGAARQVLFNPLSQYVAELLGYDTFIKGRNIGDGKIEAAGIALWHCSDLPKGIKEVVFTIRPEFIKVLTPDLLTSNSGPQDNVFSAKVVKNDITPRGYRAILNIGSGMQIRLLPSWTDVYLPGSDVQIHLPREHLKVFPNE